MTNNESRQPGVRLVASRSSAARRGFASGAMKALVFAAGVLALAIASLADTNTPPLVYVHFGIYSTPSARRLLSARIRMGEIILIAGDEYWRLSGKVEMNGTNVVADLMGDTGSQSQFYRGSITLEKPFFSQGGAASGGVIPIWFAVSTNEDAKVMVERLKEIMRKKFPPLK